MDYARKINNNENREEWLDFVRSMAIFMVVICHTLGSQYNFSVEGMQSVSLLSRLFCVVSHTFGRIGVPLFLFLTGFLLLDRPYNSKADIYRFWKRKVLPLLIAFELWTVINQIIVTLLYDNGFDWVSLIRIMLFTKNSNFNHMWYMPMIIGMYIMIPFVGRVLQKVSFKVLLVPGLLCFLYCFVVPSLNIVFRILEIDDLNRIISLDFTGGTYGLYLIVGYVCKQLLIKLNEQYTTEGGQSKQFWMIMEMFFLLLGFVGTVSFSMWCYAMEYEYLVWYDFPLLFISATALMLLIGMWKCPFFGWGIWKRLSIASTAIYYIHNLIKPVVVNWMEKILEVNRPIKVIFIGIVLFGLSFLISEFCMLVMPRVGAVLFLRKKE